MNSEIYAEAVGVLYEKNVFQLHFSEETVTPEVWGLKDWQKKLFRGMRGVGQGEDEDSADLNRAIEAPDPEGPVPSNLAGATNEAAAAITTIHAEPPPTRSFPSPSWHQWPQ